MIVVQYDQRRGAIEGYQILAIRARDGSEPWLADAEVHVHHFEPKVKLHRDKPVVELKPTGQMFRKGKHMRSLSFGNTIRGLEHLLQEPVLNFDANLLFSDPRCSEVILARPLPPVLANGRMAGGFPYGYVWPPVAVPASHRVLGEAPGVLPISNHRLMPISSGDYYTPPPPSEASDQAFKVRRWMEPGGSVMGVRLGEETVTFSTLNPYLYTPTKERPYRGIWVGDYSGHGCEFLLVHQPDSESGDDQPLERSDDESDEDYEKRFLREKVYKGRLEAIKLTGDPNVPRGEHTFIAEDLGEGGFIGNSDGPPFDGCRVVKSRGHIAAMGFRNGKSDDCTAWRDGLLTAAVDKFMESQLILISNDRLAQYWVGFGHISFFERVDIDKLVGS
ncbi:hypothetical protein JX266_003546 [Neoarthrinium moseri]|nr:hypothetical protein JX266_003546 [Neoarthrinium moseri]